jgi:hypothetical protein
MKASMSRGLGAIDSGGQKTGGRESAAAPAANSNTQKRIDGSVSVILFQKQLQRHLLLFSCFITTFVARLRLRCCSSFLLLG